MKIKPLGFYVLIEMENVENVSEGGIILNADLVNKEQEATDTGYIRAIGPTAFHGYPGCETDGGGVHPYMMWGLKLDMKIEFRRFEGKKSVVKDHENYRYIPDSHIIGAIDDE
ncbi:MAG: hypothetical protein JKY86_15355 [Gammaproteobacteria bacterium]|nr:hypothetical protein [Gammaproteobacteria bacterium]